MTDPSLIIDRPAAGVLRLTFNRPDVLNAFDTATFAAFDEQLAQAAEDGEIRAIILAARGGKAFSAGFDIHEMAAFDGTAMRHAFETRDPVFGRVAAHPLPIIAAVDGICYGAGALLALACDIRLASSAFRLKVTAVGYGGANATWSLPRLVGPARAKEILMTGRTVEAEEARAIGLVNDVVDAADLAGRAVAMAQTIAAYPPHGIAGIKSLVDTSLGLPPLQGWKAEYDWMIEHMDDAPGGGGATFEKFLSNHERKR